MIDSKIGVIKGEEYDFRENKAKNYSKIGVIKGESKEDDDPGADNQDN